MTLTLDAVVLHQVRLPLVSPFTTSFGTETERLALMLEVRTTASVGGDSREVTGWGECVAQEEPTYSSEYVAGAQAVLVEHLLPRLFAAQRERPLSAETVGEVLAPVVGHPMAKAALEMALLDAQLRAVGTSFADHLGVTVDRVPSGVSVGIQDDVPTLLR
ncbi:MAG: o-succinylbenzoate synthase, partial [Propionibacteriaceae bacterium]